MMITVTAYTIWNTKKEWEVDTNDKGREFAKRIITEGLWYTENDNKEVFVPPCNLIKVTIGLNKEGN